MINGSRIRLSARLTLNRQRVTPNRRRLGLNRRRLALNRRRLALKRRRWALSRRRLADGPPQSLPDWRSPVRAHGRPELCCFGVALRTALGETSGGPSTFALAPLCCRLSRLSARVTPKAHSFFGIARVAVLPPGTPGESPTRSPSLPPEPQETRFPTRLPSSRGCSPCPATQRRCLNIKQQINSTTHPTTVCVRTHHVPLRHPWESPNNFLSNPNTALVTLALRESHWLTVCVCLYLWVRQAPTPGLLGTTRHHRGMGWGVGGYPPPPPERTTTPSVIGQNVPPGLRPIGKFLWRLQRQLVSTNKFLRRLCRI